MRVTLVSFVLCVWAGFAAAGSAQVDWSDLIDESAQAYEDPYQDLTFDQLSALRILASAEVDLASGEMSSDARSRLQARLGKADAMLVSDGIDADWLISQRWIVADRREKAMSSGNPELDGVEIAIGGFAIPAAPEEDGTRVAYLVPQRGMCSHTPPPAPNQLIRLRLGNDWTPAMMHEPVIVSGRLSIDPSKRQMLVVDGFKTLNTTFTLDVAKVQTLNARGAEVVRTNAGTHGTANKILADGKPDEKNN